MPNKSLPYELQRELPKPFFVLAPMDDVTDVVFRQVIDGCAEPDLYFTEFVNVDGLQSPGREKLLPKLLIGPNEGSRLIAQIWGKTPENYYKTARQLVDGSLQAEAEYLNSKDSKHLGLSKMQESNEKRVSRTDGTVSESRRQMPQQFAKNHSSPASLASGQTVVPQVFRGFAGVDINMGCPDKSIVKNGCCSALINDRGLTGEIIAAVREGVGPDFPVSVKTRLGYNDIDFTWHEYLLSFKLNMLTIHGRTKKQMSKVPADWDAIGSIANLRTSLAPQTLIVGNGDVLSRSQGLDLAQKQGLDGIMIGRGVFHDPYIFAKGVSPWAGKTQQQRIDLYTSHVKLFAQTWLKGERKLHTLNKFCKVYIQDFPGAKELREKLMNAQSADELINLLQLQK